MAVETFCPETVEEIKILVENKKNDVDQLWIYKTNNKREKKDDIEEGDIEEEGDTYIGSLLPKVKGLTLVYDNVNKTLMLLLYKNNSRIDTKGEYILDEIILTISDADLNKYTYNYL